MSECVCVKKKGRGEKLDPKPFLKILYYTLNLETKTLFVCVCVCVGGGGEGGGV